MRVVGDGTAAAVVVAVDAAALAEAGPGGRGHYDETTRLTIAAGAVAGVAHVGEEARAAAAVGGRRTLVVGNLVGEDKVQAGEGCIAGEAVESVRAARVSLRVWNCLRARGCCASWLWMLGRRGWLGLGLGGRRLDAGLRIGEAVNLELVYST